MKMISNRISTKTNTMSLSEWAKTARTQAALTKTASTKAPAKVAEKDKKCEKCGCFPCKEGCVGCTASAKTEAKVSAKTETKVVKAEGGKSDEAESSGQLEPKANPNNDPKVDGKANPTAKGGTKKNDEQGPDSGQPKAEAKLVNHPKVEEAKSKGKYVKVANLTGKQKEFLRKVWSNYWPSEFIDALLTDK